MPENSLTVFFKMVSRFDVLPAADVFQILRKIPVIDRHERLDMITVTGIDQSVIESQTLLVDIPLKITDDPWPGQRETISILTAFCHHADVFFVVMIMIGSNITVFQSVLMKVTIPHGLRFFIKIPCAFTLVGSCRTSPKHFSLHKRIISFLLFTAVSASSPHGESVGSPNDAGTVGIGDLFVPLIRFFRTALQFRIIEIDRDQTISFFTAVLPGIEIKG